MISIEYPPEKNATQIWSHIRSAVGDSNHPFRLLTLSTSSKDAKPQSRIVVLREADDQNTLLMYTDSRSDKVSHIRENPSGCLQFWDPGRQLQVTIGCSLECITTGKQHEKHNAGIKGRGRALYTTKASPGENLGPSFQEPEHWDFDQVNYFALIRAEATEMTALQLHKDHHLRMRCRFNRGSWQGTWIVP